MTREMGSAETSRTMVIALVALALLATSGFLVGCARGEGTARRPAVTSTTEKTQASSTVAMMTITLYFADEQAEGLVAEQRGIPKTEGVARAVLEELIKGPEETGNFATIPEGTRLVSVEIRDGVAYASFSEELSTKHGGGSAGELMTIGSIVNSLTELPAIKKVQILIEGKVVQTLAGHADITQPLARNEELILER